MCFVLTLLVATPQDVVEAYFNYLRTCGGSCTHPDMVAVEAARRGKVMTAAMSAKSNSKTGTDSAKDIARRRKHFNAEQASQVPCDRQQNQHGGMMEKRRQEMLRQNAVATANASE